MVSPNANPGAGEHRHQGPVALRPGIATPGSELDAAGLIARRDLLGQAATGAGKTAAFALPLLQGLLPGSRSKQPTALVLVATRERAIQVSEAVYRYGRELAPGSCLSSVASPSAASWAPSTAAST